MLRIATRLPLMLTVLLPFCALGAGWGEPVLAQSETPKTVAAAGDGKSSSEAATTETSETRVTSTLPQGAEDRIWQLDLLPGAAAQSLVLDLEPGTYVYATVEPGADLLQLDLSAADGTFKRRLLQAGDARRDFNLVVGEKGERFEASVPAEAAPTRMTLHVEKNVAPGGFVQGDAPSELKSPHLRTLRDNLQDAGALDRFWQEMSENGTPLVEELAEGEAGDDKVLLTYLYRGAEQNVRILGSPSSDHDYMHRLPETDVWYRSYEVPRDTRLSYRLAPDIPDVPGSFWEKRVAILATAQADPLNKQPWPAEAVDPWRQKSVVELSEAPPQPFVAPDETIAAGSTEDFAFASDRLGNTRRVTLYRPSNFNPQDPATLLLVLFDGDAYQSEVDVPGILDRMQAFNVLPQTVAILVANPDMKTRTAELPGNETFSEVLAQQLVPLAQEKLGTAIPAERTVLAGSSYGGLASVRISLEHPDVFGNALSMSGSFWWSPKDTPETDAEYTARQVVESPKQEVRLFLSAGIFETSRNGDLDILHTNRHLRDVLEAKGYRVTLKEYAGSHDYLVWRGALSDGLMELFGVAP